MSAAEEYIERRNDEGVLLRYHPSRMGSHHIEQRPQPSDRVRGAVLRAERAVRLLETIAECLDIAGDSGFAAEMWWPIRTIRAYIELERPALGMHRPRVEA
jgi:hypothetical protein